MSTEPQDTKPTAPSGTKSPRSPIFIYLIALFAAAFLLLLMSYFMQQRRNDQEVIDGLQANMSAMQTAQNVIERNQVLMEENKALREENKTLQEQAEALAEQQETQEKTILALDWLWRIEREYFQGRYTSARTLIREFEQAGLDAYLPDEPLADPDYRTPAHQYKSIYNLLF